MRCHYVDTNEERSSVASVDNLVTGQEVFCYVLIHRILSPLLPLSLLTHPYILRILFLFIAFLLPSLLSLEPWDTVKVD